jgi:hypothetical protein
MNETNGSGGGPRLAVLAITEWTDKAGVKRSRWTRVGVAFRNRDASLTLLMHAFPIGSDKLQVREERTEDAAPAGRGNGLETLEVGP